MENQSKGSGPQGPISFRRKFPRRVFRRNVGVLSGGKYFVTTGFEIGEGGLSFVSDRILKVGALVVVNFQVPDGDFISVRAEIRNSEIKPGDPQVSKVATQVYGCAFESLTFDRKREIRNFVTNRPESEV